MLCERERAGCKKQWKSDELLLVVGRRIGVYGLLRDEEAAFCALCRGCVAAALKSRPPLVYMMAAGKMGIEAAFVKTVSSLQKEGC